MSARQVALSLLVAMIVLVAFNFWLRHSLRNSVPRQLLHALDSSRGFTHLALGNSLMAAGFDPAVFDRYMNQGRVIAFNGALGASSQVEHLTLLREALRRDSSIKVVIYGFFDFQLTEPVVTRNSDLIGNLAASYYLEPDLALRFYIMSPRDRFEFEAMRHVPMLAERGAIWGKVEAMRRAMGQVGMPPVETNRFGRATDFGLLEAQSPDAFVSECEHWSGVGDGLNKPALEIIREAEARGAKVVIVEMPMHPFHQQHFYALDAWHRYRNSLRTLVERNGAEYISASGWITDPGEFADHLHLTPRGAEEFSRRLALQLRSSQD